MNDNIVLVNLPASENEVGTNDPIFVSMLPDSPCSMDSGVVGSPSPVFDISTPSSPNILESIEQDSRSSKLENQSIFIPVVGTVQNTQFIPAGLPAVPSSPPQTPSIPVQTKGLDEKAIQKLLELLVSSKSTAEPVLRLLSNILGNTLKKDHTVKPQLPVVKKVPQPGIPNDVTVSRKRPGIPCNNEIATKGPRLDSTNCGLVLPSIVVLEQPEQNYRARYESEGCRGPVHGSSDMTFPTIKVEGYSDPLWVTVYLATNKGTPHFHLLCGPGSTKLPCRNIMLPGGIPAIQVLVGPETGMTAVLDCISLKRKRNFEADKELKRRGLNPADWKSERKEACFVFTAEIPGSPPNVVKCQSRVFQCTAPPGNPEIWWMKPEKGSVLGGDEIGLIGKKFPKVFKVRFFGELPSGEKWEAFGNVDRSKSNQGAGVVKTPCLQHPISSPLTVNVEVCSGKGVNCLSSDSVEFTYLPSEKPTGRETAVPLAYDILPDNLAVSDLIDAMAHYVREPANQPPVSSKDKGQKEWQELLSALQLLHQNGSISANQLKELKTLVTLKDAVLLQVFRSTRQSFSETEFQEVFRHYLSGLCVSQD